LLVDGFFFAPIFKFIFSKLIFVFRYWLTFWY